MGAVPPDLKVFLRPFQDRPAVELPRPSIPLNFGQRFHPDRPRHNLLQDLPGSDGIPPEDVLPGDEGGLQLSHGPRHVEVPQLPPRLHGGDGGVELIEFRLEGLDLVEDRPRRLPVGHCVHEPGDLPLHLGAAFLERRDLRRVVRQGPPNIRGGLVEDVPQGNGIQDGVLHAVQ